MRPTLDHIANSVFFVLGTIHTVLTLLYQRPFDLDALMYVGAGLAFIFLASLNFCRVKTSDPLTKLFSFVCNTIALLYMFLIAIVFADPRVFIAIGALLVLAVASAIDFKLSIGRQPVTK